MEYTSQEIDLGSWCDSRETSYEVGAAIMDLYPEERQRVWEEPTEEESESVLGAAFSNCQDDVLYWGEESFRRPE